MPEHTHNAEVDSCPCTWQPPRNECAAQGCVLCQTSLAEDLAADLPQQVYPRCSNEVEALVQLLGVFVLQLAAEGGTYIFDYEFSDDMRSRLRLGITKDLRAGKSFPDWRRVVRNDDYYPEDYEAWPETMAVIDSFFE